MALEQYNVQTNPFAILQKKISDGGSSSRLNLMHALILNQAHHQGVMEHLERSAQLEKERMAHGADISETAATAEHGRRKELIQSFKKMSEPGTSLAYSQGDMSISLTTKKPRVKKPKLENKPTFPPVVIKDEPQQEPPVAPAASTPKPSVNRDPKTGRAVSLNPNKKKAPKRKNK